MPAIGCLLPKQGADRNEQFDWSTSGSHRGGYWWVIGSRCLGAVVGRLPQRDLGQTLICASRPLLELVLRQKAEAIANLEIRSY